MQHSPKSFRTFLPTCSPHWSASRRRLQACRARLKIDSFAALIRGKDLASCLEALKLRVDPMDDVSIPNSLF